VNFIQILGKVAEISALYDMIEQQAAGVPKGEVVKIRPPKDKKPPSVTVKGRRIELVEIQGKVV